MNNDINKHFDFFLLEAEAETIEAEAEEIEAFITAACGYLDSRQRNNIIERITPILNKLHGAATKARTEANRRKANIEKIEDQELKEMVTLFYVKRLTLERIADILYCDRTTISKKVKRYCKRYLEKG